MMYREAPVLDNHKAQERDSKKDLSNRSCGREMCTLWTDIKESREAAVTRPRGASWIFTNLKFLDLAQA